MENEDSDLGLQYSVGFDVKTGGDKATAEIEALSKGWQSILDKQELSIKMGAKAEQGSTANSNAPALEKTENTLKEMSQYYQELSDRAKDFYDANQSDKSAALDGMKERLVQIKQEILDILNLESSQAQKSNPLMFEQGSDLDAKAGWIADLKKEAAEINAAMESLNNLKMGGETADITAINSELGQTNFELLQMKEHYIQVGAEASKLVKDATSKANTKDVLGMKESSIDEIEAKIQRLDQSMRLFSETAGRVGMNDDKLNGAFHKASDEVGRLTQKLQVLKSSFGNQSLGNLLEVNPTSIREANALMSELSNRKKDLNRSDSGYISNMTSINKKQGELSSQNAKEAQMGAEKTKQLHAQNSAYEDQGRLVNNLKSIALQYISIYGAINLVKSIAETTGMFELQRVSLNAIIQDTEKAGEIFEQVKTLAIVSPFQFKDLITYTKQLAAFRIPADELFDTMKSLADVSAGLGVDMDRIILAYGQVSAASVLNGKTLRQFSQAGIPMVSLLADQFTKLEGKVVTTGDVFGKISQRLVPFKMVKDIFTGLTTEGGMFFNMQEIQAETLKGKISNLVDAYTIMFNSMGSTGAVNDGLKGSVDLLMNMAKNWETIGAIILPIIGTLGLYKGGMIAVGIAQKAYAAITGASAMVAQASAMASEKEAAAIALKTVSLEANTLVNKAGIAADGARAAISEVSTNLYTKETTAQAVRTLVIKAGTDTQKLANLESAISNVLVAKGMTTDEASAAAKVILANATAEATDETVTFGDAMMASMATNPIGWIMGIIAVLATLAVGIWAVVSGAHALDNELSTLGGSGATESAKLTARFAELSNTVMDNSKSIKQHDDAMNTLKQVYKDILPLQMLTVEGIKALKGNYESATQAIYEYIAAKTKEKQLDAISKSYSAQIEPTNDKITDQLQGLGIDAKTAKQAVIELNKEISDKSLSANDAWTELPKILEKINGSEMKAGWWGTLRGYADDAQISVMKLAFELGNQKKAVDNLTSTSPATFYGRFSDSMKTLDADVKKTTGTMIQGVNSMTGMHFKESLFEFDARKAEIERQKLMTYLNGLTSEGTKAVSNQPKAVWQWDISGNNKGAVGFNKAIEDTQSRIKRLDLSPFDKAQDKMVQKAVNLKNAGTQFDDLFVSGRDPEDYLKQVKSDFDESTKSIESAKAATSKYNTQLGNITDLSGKQVGVTWKQQLDGYHQLIDGQSVYNTGLKYRNKLEGDLLNANGVADKTITKNGKDRNAEAIKSLEDRASLLKQANAEYEKLLKAGQSPDQAKSTTEDLFKGILNPKAIPFTDAELSTKLKWIANKLATIPKGEQPAFKIKTEVLDIDTKIITDQLEAKLKAIEDEFNGSKKRIDLFKNIFDATGGDYDLAGRIAKSFEGEGTTNIETALRTALKAAFKSASFNPDSLFDSKGNVNIPAAQAEIDTQKKNSVGGLGNSTTAAMQKQLDATKDFEEKDIEQLLKGLSKYSDYEAKRTEIIRVGVEERKKIYNNPDMSSDEKDTYTTASTNKQSEGLAKQTTDQFKESDLWQEVFGNLDKTSNASIELLKTRIQQYINIAGKGLAPTEMVTLNKALDDMKKRTATVDLGAIFKAVFTKIDLAPLKKKADEAQAEYDRLINVRDEADIRKSNADLNVNSMEVAGTDKSSPMAYQVAKDSQGAATTTLTKANKDLAASQVLVTTTTTAYVAASNNAKNVILSGKDGIEQDIKGLNEMKGAVSGVIDAFYSMSDALGITINPDTKVIIDDIVKSIGAMVAVLSAVAAIMALVDVIASPILIIAAALAVVVAGFAILHSLSLQAANDQIQIQADHLAALQIQWDALNNSMKAALGTEYIEDYNAELVNLQAQIVAVQAQYAAENSKGKDLDKTKLASYTAEIAADQQKIIDNQNSFEASLAGSDLTDEAKSFAQAWLDAYLSYSNTTDSMTAKFKSMMTNMVVNAGLAALAVVALKPVYDAIDAATSATSDGGASITSAEMNTISAATDKASADYNAAATGYVDGLSATTKTLLESGTNLTGVSKGISEITEDTALLLGGYLDSIRLRLFAYFDAWTAFDIVGSMAALMVAQNMQITHLAAINNNTLRSAIASEKLTDQLDKVTSITGNKGVFSLNVNT